MKLSEQVKVGKSLIEDPENWMQGDYYDEGESFKTACKFCSLGAARYATETEHDMNKVAGLLEYILRIEHVPYSVSAFNDTNQHKEVMRLWDNAIEAALEEENEQAN